MSNPKFKIGFHYQHVMAPLVLSEQETVEVEMTTCTIENDKGEELASKSVVPYHKSVHNRLLARKLAFEATVNSMGTTTETRRELWNQFLETHAIPKPGKARIRSIEALVRRFNGVSQEDAETLCKYIRKVLTAVKKDTVATVNEDAPIAIPNAEPLDTPILQEVG